MKSFGNAVVKARHLILILAFVLLVPAVWGYTHTRVNYDILTYLPDSIETIKGQDILMNEFGTGAITMLIVEDKNDKEIVALEEEIRKVDHVKKVLWYDSFADITIPKEMLPERIRDGCYLQGMSAVITDTKDLAEAEEPIYVALAVLLSSVILALSMDTFLAPVFFLRRARQCCSSALQWITRSFCGTASRKTSRSTVIPKMRWQRRSMRHSSPWWGHRSRRSPVSRRCAL